MRSVALAGDASGDQVFDLGGTRQVVEGPPHAASRELVAKLHFVGHSLEGASRPRAPVVAAYSRAQGGV
jgi:hypothetical protein